MLETKDWRFKKTYKPGTQRSFKELHLHAALNSKGAIPSLRLLLRLSIEPRDVSAAMQGYDN